MEVIRTCFDHPLITALVLVAGAVLFTWIPAAIVVGGIGNLLFQIRDEMKYKR